MPQGILFQAADLCLGDADFVSDFGLGFSFKKRSRIILYSRSGSRSMASFKEMDSTHRSSLFFYL